MLKSLVAATCAFLATSCVQPTDEGEISRSQREQRETAACLVPVTITQPLPTFQAWNGALPQAQSPDVVWMVTPLDLYGKDWALYQMDVIKDYVVTRHKFGSTQRQDVMRALGSQLATLGGVRVGGPRPGPVGDPADLLAQAKALRASGM